MKRRLPAWPPENDYDAAAWQLLTMMVAMVICFAYLTTILIAAVTVPAAAPCSQPTSVPSPR